MALVDVHYSDGIATVTMNDPPTRNAISVPMREEMAGLFQNFEADPEVRCVVLRGAGDHFMSGGDVKTFAGYVREYTKPQLQAGFRQRIATLNPLLTAMRRLPKPILASVQGGAVGAGTGLAMACDLVIAAENAFFVMAYRNIGTSPDGSSSFSLPRAIGMKKAMEMVLLGGRLTAGEALDLGMINFVVPADQLAEETTRILCVDDSVMNDTSNRSQPDGSMRREMRRVGVRPQPRERPGRSIIDR